MTTRLIIGIKTEKYEQLNSPGFLNSEIYEAHVASVRD